MIYRTYIFAFFSIALCFSHGNELSGFSVSEIQFESIKNQIFIVLLCMPFGYICCATIESNLVKYISRQFFTSSIPFSVGYFNFRTPKYSVFGYNSRFHLEYANMWTHLHLEAISSMKKVAPNMLVYGWHCCNY